MPRVSNKITPLLHEYDADNAPKLPNGFKFQYNKDKTKITGVKYEYNRILPIYEFENYKEKDVRKYCNLFIEFIKSCLILEQKINLRAAWNNFVDNLDDLYAD